MKHLSSSCQKLIFFLLFIKGKKKVISLFIHVLFLLLANNVPANTKLGKILLKYLPTYRHTIILVSYEKTWLVCVICLLTTNCIISFFIKYSQVSDSWRNIVAAQRKQNLSQSETKGRSMPS